MTRKSEWEERKDVLGKILFGVYVLVRAKPAHTVDNESNDILGRDL